MNKTSIIIVTYNNLAYNKGVLETIRKYTKEGSYEVILVDNASTDGTRKWLDEMKESGHVKVILNDKNVGFLKGCNIGLSAADLNSDILLLNNDIEVTHNWLENLQTALSSTTKIGAVGGLKADHFDGALNKKGEVINFNTKDPSEIHEFAVYNNQSDPTRWKYSNALYGYCLLIKREVINKIDLFDERFTSRMFGDDDLSFRILEAGYYLLQCYDCFIHHFKSQSFEEEMIKHQTCLDINSQKFMKKWGFNGADKRVLHDNLLRLLEAEKALPIHVLHIGCGLGRTLFEVKNRYPLAHLYGIETNKAHANVIENIINLQAEPCTAFPLKFEAQLFDFILISEGYEPSENLKDFLVNIKKYLKPQGQLILNIQNIMHYSVLKNLLDGHWHYAKNLIKKNHAFLTAPDIERFSQECGYFNPLIFHWYTPTNETDEAFIKKLCGLGGEDKAYLYRTYLYTVRLQNAIFFQRELKIQNCPLPEKDHLLKVLKSIPIEQKENFVREVEVHGYKIRYASSVDTRVLDVLKIELEPVLVKLHILKDQVDHPAIKVVDSQKGLYRYKASRQFYDFSIVYLIKETEIIILFKDLFFVPRNQKVDEKLKRIEKDFPTVMTTKQTLEYIIKHRCSLVRFGDGEFNLALGYPIIFQNTNTELQNRLTEILGFPNSSTVLISMTAYSSKEDNKNLFGQVSEWEHYWYKYYDRLKPYLKNSFYGNATVSRKSVFLENDLSEIKKLWDGRDVVFVTGDGGRFEIKEALFDNIKNHTEIKVPAVDAFSQYDDILAQCLKENTTKLFMISCGPTATVLAFDLAQKGYQALDIGHLPNAYDQFLGLIQSPELLPLITS